MFNLNVIYTSSQVASRHQCNLESQLQECPINNYNVMVKFEHQGHI